MNDLISVIVPVYDAARFLDDTINTVLAQTYTNWELILVDDHSTDNSVEIIKSYREKDARIKLFTNAKNSGAAISRNRGIDESHGRYITFLDSDDLWVPEKLERQVGFMRSKNCAFSFTSYQFADSTGKPNGKSVTIPSTINYKQSLKNHIIWTSTVMLDMMKLAKQAIHMPDVRRGQDAATWWRILKVVDYAHGLDETLSYYRRTSNSLSANKLTAMKRTWYLLREVEGLSLAVAGWNFVWYGFNAVRKRV
jgi:teichuronic acid biosynthesis glycosyltransferase TuaG